MKASTLLSVSFATALFWSCTPSTEPESRPVDGARIGQAVNALSKAGAVRAGYSVAREAADTSSDVTDLFASEQIQQQMRAIGICENFIQLVAEFGNGTAVDSNGFSPRFAKVVQCLEDKVMNMSYADASPESIYPVFDQCFCDGSGSVFAAIRAYAWNGYHAPALNEYSAPNSGTYRTPAVPDYHAPALPDYKSPGGM